MLTLLICILMTVLPAEPKPHDCWSSKVRTVGGSQSFFQVMYVRGSLSPTVQILGYPLLLVTPSKYR